jgi:hypothetical protein
VLSRAVLDLAIEGTAYTADEVAMWSGYRGKVVTVRAADRIARVDFSSELQPMLQRVQVAEASADESKLQLEQVVATSVAHEMHGKMMSQFEATLERLQSELKTQMVRRSKYIMAQ